MLSCWLYQAQEALENVDWDIIERSQVDGAFKSGPARRYNFPAILITCTAPSLFEERCELWMP